MQNEDTRVFIAYQGTYDTDNGSVLKAGRIYDFLKEKGVNCYFFPKMIDKKFGQTPIIASHSDLFLLVANHNIKTDSNNEVASGGLRQEIEAFYDEIYKGKRKLGDARVYAYGDLSMDQADDLHLMFHNIEHFNENQFGEEECLKRVYNWAKLECDCKTIVTPETANEVKFSLPELFKQSRCFFRNSILAICEIPDSEYYPIYQKYSRLFACNAVLKTNEILTYDGELFDFLTEKIENATEVNVLKVSGNTGSDKNALMQNLYLNIYRRALAGKNNLLPLYINLALYEKQRIEKDINKIISEKISADLSYFCEYMRRETERVPIIFIDGLRNFKISQTSIEMILEKVIHPFKNLRKVVSIDNDFKQNPSRNNEISSLAPTTFSYYLKLQPIDLEDEEICREYFKNLGDLYNVDVTNLFANLKNLFFYEIDTYIVKLVIDMISQNQGNTSFTVSDLYYAMSVKHLNCNEELLLETAANAFDFLYTDKTFADEDVFGHRGWTLIKRHRTVVDFLIAYYYVDRLKRIEGPADLSFFEIILPKEVTRFVTPLINKSAGCQEKVIEIVRKYYNDLGTFGKSEFTYWLGRLEIKKYREEAQQLLYTFYRQQLDLIAVKRAKGSYNPIEEKTDLFILRGITVSLIYYNDEEMLDKYLFSMIENDQYNMINRGFHLAYYGDKPYVANKQMLDFDDDVEIGEKTMKHLSNKLIKKMKTPSYPATLKLDLFTLCSLIQARIELPETQEKFFRYNRRNKTHYLKVCEECLQKYNEQSSSYLNDKISLYFMMFYEDLHTFNNSKMSSLTSEYYDNFANVSDINRTGWLNLEIPKEDCETVTEHIYNTWLMGMLYLPTAIEYRNDYDKDKILKMILIHDLAESITGDIPSPLKKNNSRYDEDEDLVMRKLLLKGTYDSIQNLDDYYQLWEEFVQGQSINARIAKELDTIQLLYQFCKYYLKYPDRITENIKNDWLRSRANIKTNVGRDIFKKLVEQNKNYAQIFENSFSKE